MRRVSIRIDVLFVALLWLVFTGALFCPYPGNLSIPSISSPSSSSSVVASPKSQLSSGGGGGGEDTAKPYDVHGQGKPQTGQYEMSSPAAQQKQQPTTNAVLPSSFPQTTVDETAQVSEVQSNAPSNRGVDLLHFAMFSEFPSASDYVTTEEAALQNQAHPARSGAARSSIVLDSTNTLAGSPSSPAEAEKPPATQAVTAFPFKSNITLVYGPMYVMQRPSEALPPLMTSSDDEESKNKTQWNISQRVDDLLSEALELMDGYSNSMVKHTRYVLARQYLTNKLVEKRRSKLLDRNRTDCFEFLRPAQLPSDEVYRVPCITWRTRNLKSVEMKRYGLYAQFKHIDPPDASFFSSHHRVLHEIPTGRPPLKIAVEMSGHMRTFRRCYASQVKHLLEPNHALLFIATYPDLGDKRFGIRYQEFDLPVAVDEIADYYAPYLAGLYLADLPTVTRELSSIFSKLFADKQWSWMIYQLFMMEMAHNITLAETEEESRIRLDEHDPTDLQYIVPDIHLPQTDSITSSIGRSSSTRSSIRVLGEDNGDGEGRVAVKAQRETRTSQNDGSSSEMEGNAGKGTRTTQQGGESGSNRGRDDGSTVGDPQHQVVQGASSMKPRRFPSFWDTFDVAVRIRPDLYIIGPAWIRSTSESSAIFNFTCGNHMYSEPFKANELIRAPHHPEYQWVLDHLSDHSAIGFMAQITSFLHLYSDVLMLGEKKYLQKVFKHGATAERIWGDHTTRKGLKVIGTKYGWHFMLRHPTKFKNSTVTIAKSQRRAFLTMKIFGVTDPADVKCPNVYGNIWTLPPKPKLVRGKVGGSAKK